MEFEKELMCRRKGRKRENMRETTLQNFLDKRNAERLYDFDLSVKHFYLLVEFFIVLFIFP